MSALARIQPLQVVPEYQAAPLSVKNCMIGGGVGIVGHLEIADHVVVTGMTMVTKSITEPGVYSSGVPAQENASWNRTSARLRQLDKLARRLQTLERRLSADEKQGKG